jgi:hypothetical protein
MNYFVWEKDFAGRWSPVVYHGDKPPKSVNGGEMERSSFFPIAPEFMGADGNSPMFGILKEKYPKPH